MLYFKNFGPPVDKELKDELSKDVDAIVAELKKRGEKITREEVIKELWLAAQDFDMDAFTRRH